MRLKTREMEAHCGDTRMYRRDGTVGFINGDPPAVVLSFIHGERPSGFAMGPSIPTPPSAKPTMPVVGTLV